MEKNDMKNQLANCLKELMTTQTIDKIAIQDITSQLNVSRQTFYYHFEDIYALLHWTLQKEAIHLLQDKEMDLLWKEGILALFHYLEENKQFVRSAIESLGADRFKRFFYGEVFEIIQSVTTEFGKDFNEDKKYTDFLSHFYTIGLPTIAISWVQDEMDFTAEEMIEMMDKTFKDQLYGAQHRQ
jgi:probable dihydroxyacetone kinase regulator